MLSLRSVRNRAFMRPIVVGRGRAERIGFGRMKAMFAVLRIEQGKFLGRFRRGALFALLRQHATANCKKRGDVARRLPEKIVEVSEAGSDASGRLQHGTLLCQPTLVKGLIDLAGTIESFEQIYSLLEPARRAGILFGQIRRRAKPPIT